MGVGEQGISPLDISFFLRMGMCVCVCEGVGGGGYAKSEEIIHKLT